ncbi:MAG: hypothetical protein J5717_13690 [Lachnospiraceae bacterium]|nr:hypothetical protein [Lachnospiraceae bacterium]MBR5762138.1 hypothetical protein [Lachnospiraceae bacterium]
MVLFAFFGALMFTSKQILEFLPNVHMLGMFTMLFAIVYRGKGIIPVIVFILLEGAYTGFGIWWIPYWYLWPILFLVALALPRKMPSKVAIPVYMIVCALHGLCYGTLYAPFQAIAFGLSLKGTLAWIAAGFPWDCVHAAGNFCFGALVYPLSRLLIKLENSTNNSYY